MLDVLSLERVRPPDFEVDVARILVNGKDLAELAGDVERPFASAEGHPEIAGQYQGLAWHEVAAPSRHLLGEPLAWTMADENERVTLLGCECGEAGCWPLVARIELDDETVRWSNFAQPHRPTWRYDSLGPFTFDRRAYEEALTGTMTLYRPVGARELELIAASGYRAFPPRLAQQPIFYPVLNEEYAVQIARDWNTKDEASGYVGFVTRFRVDAAFAGRHEPQTVGASMHRELWVPAEELDVFNAHIVGLIDVIAEFRASAKRI